MSLDRWLGNETDHPMYIVTAKPNKGPAGCLVGFATQCSIDPLRFVVFLSTKNHTYQAAARAEGMGVNAIPRDRKDLAELFGGKTGDDTDKFSLCDWRLESDVPILDDASAWFVGRVVDRFPAGDHVGFVLEPTEGTVEDAAFLGFQATRDITPGRAP